MSGGHFSDVTYNARQALDQINPLQDPIEKLTSKAEECGRQYDHHGGRAVLP